MVIGSELDGSRSKKEEIVEEALKQLYAKGSGDIAEKKALTAMVGDRKFDIEGARAQEVDAIGVSYGYQEPGELSAKRPRLLQRRLLRLRGGLLRPGPRGGARGARGAHGGAGAL